MYVAISKFVGSTQGKYLIVHRFLNWYDLDSSFPTDKQELNDKHWKVQQIYKNNKKERLQNWHSCQLQYILRMASIRCIKLPVHSQYFYPILFWNQFYIGKYYFLRFSYTWFVYVCWYFYFILYLIFINFSSDLKTTRFVKLHLCNIWCNELEIWNWKFPIFGWIC